MMNNINQFTDQKLGNRIRLDLNFEDYFNGDIPPEKIQFVKHYLEHHMGIAMDENLFLDLSDIGVKLFGCLLVDLLMNYEKYHENTLDG